MLPNAHQFAVSYPFVRCHDSLVLKKRNPLHRMQMQGGGVEKKTERRVAECAHDSLCISSPCPYTPNLALLLSWTVLTTQMTGNQYVFFNTTNANFCWLQCCSCGCSRCKYDRLCSIRACRGKCVLSSPAHMICLMDCLEARVKVEMVLKSSAKCFTGMDLGCIFFFLLVYVTRKLCCTENC